MEGLAIHGEPSSSQPQHSSRSSSQPSSSQPAASGSSSKRARSPSSGKRNSKEAYDEDDNSPPPEEDELYVALRTDVVGIQYYAGLVGAGEMVMLKRQPSNPYDSNAVQVVNAGGVQVGHVPRAVAARLSPLLDAKLITVEGKMIGQNIDGKMRYKLPIEMSIYGRPSHRPHLEPELEWATPGQKGFDSIRNGQGSSSQSKGKGKDDAEMRRILDGLTKVNEDEKAADSVMAALTADLDVSKLPQHPSPPSITSGDLLVNLLPHQSQALQWMVDHENPVLPSKVGDTAVQFWSRAEKSGKEYWLNVATKTPQSEKPILGRGGLVADGMGLGKTLTTLSLILATKKDKAAKGFSQSTLIVCPLSVLSNWQKQIEDHIVGGKLNAYTYYGPNKDASATTLAQYDIVLTTYQTVAAEAPSSALSTPIKAKSKKAKTSASGGSLMQVKWKRVVADEGHVMKNPKARMTQAFVALSAERRWVLTGTPIVNAPNDLGSLLTCLRVCAPLDQLEYFRSLVLRPLKKGSPEAGRLLQAIVGQVLLRRTKDSTDKQGNRLVALPPIEYYQCPVKLDPETRAIYNEVLAESARRFQESMRTGNPGINVLSMLTRMRQLCLSADMVPQSYLADMRTAPAEPTGPAVSISSLAPDDREKLIEKLKQAVQDQEECPVCFDIMNDPRITDCGHPFCFACITEVIHRQALCPLDRHPLSTGSLLELPPDAIEEDDDGDHAVKPPVRSSKIIELVKYLHAFDKNDKILVFSQFTSFLDRVAAVLEEEGVMFCRFDGSMPAKKRQEVIAQFQKPVTEKNRKRNPVVMLISLKSGAVGLNLTTASNVFLCDPWWQSAIEAQAVDRVHRMGQTKTVRVFQLIAEDTIESKVLDIQREKDDMVAKAFAKSGAGESKAAKKQARFEELKTILGIKS